jgi:predicted secreted hydrolase
MRSSARQAFKSRRHKPHKTAGMAALRSMGILLLLATVNHAADPAQYQVAKPGYHYQFPRDHFNHPAFKTEWWYYTGNLATKDGRHFGFELTFFRQAIRRDSKPGVWAVPDVYLAHFTVSDLAGHRFLQTERLNRPGDGLAGADLAQARVWNGNWQAQWQLGPGQPGGFRAQTLQAIAEKFSVRLRLTSEKPPVLHGTNGVSQKAEGAGHASHYISLTRLQTSGSLEIGGQRFEVAGLSWMDHEFFTNQLAADQAGWDWFSLQLEDGSELMLYRLRQKDGTASRWSHGTFVDAQGRSRGLSASEFQLTPGATWTSLHTGARYPVIWRIAVPVLSLDLSLQTRLEPQELTSGSELSPSYWEGAIEVAGTHRGKPIAGRGYLEMTGYDKPLDLDR